MCTPKSTALTATSATTQATTPYASRHHGWSPEKQAIFLRALAASHSVAQAARVAGMSRQSAYDLRARLKGEPFDLAWHAALQCRFDALAEAALERALHGVEVPHYYKGELVGTSRRFDERLTVALFAMRDRLGPRAAPQWHPSAHYDRSDFSRLVARVEEGPATWHEEWLEDREAALDECGAECGEDASDAGTGA